MAKLYVVGFGPGDEDGMTVRARKVIEDCEIVVGYTVYTELMEKIFPHKQFISTPMRREEERVALAIEKATEGTDTALVCSGDSGVYGMAGLALTMAAGREDVQVIPIPGVTAAVSGGALLGAPLTHDFSVISLSDLLTPWEKIEKRLECAAMSDMTIVLYNPSSKKRADYLEKACNIIMKHRSPDTVCGIAERIGRAGECSEVLTLGELSRTQVDMFATVFIGNSSSVNIGGKMVTPRGYRSQREIMEKE